jgi:glycosyltransferase involved in cell wall biosynthesis
MTTAVNFLSSACCASVMRKIYFIYGSGRGFSGQRFASEMLVEGLRRRGWQVGVIQTPVLDRIGESNSEKGWGELLVLGLHLLAAWLKGLWLVSRPEMLHVNLGQTRFALLRDGLPLLVRSILGSSQAIISLHGNVFMGWDKQSLEVRLLRRMVRAARYITVLGPNQQKRLGDFGIPAEKVIQLDNTCLITPVTEQECIEKQGIPIGEPLKILFLSSLIETKGYPEFVEAISHLASEDNLPIEAILCGKITSVESDQRFPTRTEAKNWLEDQIRQINQSSHVRLRWINGAEGQAKENLLREAHLFVLPSRYKVEAQPITILEALASGCAVITTQAGEIPAMLNSQTAVLLDEATPVAIAGVVEKLYLHPQNRQHLALNGLKLFNDRFAYSRHLDQWEQLLNE